MKTGNLVIKWYHNFEEVDQQHMTVCEVLTNNAKFYGTALCHKKDQFCKAVGRKLSLARALRIAGLSKEQRKQVWEDYRMMTPKKRW